MAASLDKQTTYKFSMGGAHAWTFSSSSENGRVSLTTLVCDDVEYVRLRPWDMSLCRMVVEPLSLNKDALKVPLYKLPGYNELLAIRKRAYTDLTSGDTHLRDLFAVTSDEPTTIRGPRGSLKPRPKRQAKTVAAADKPITIQLPMEDGGTRALNVIGPNTEKDVLAIPLNTDDIRDVVDFIRRAGLDPCTLVSPKRAYNKRTLEERQQPLRKRYPALYDNTPPAHHDGDVHKACDGSDESDKGGFE